MYQHIFGLALIGQIWFSWIALAGDTTNTAYYSTPTAQPTGLRTPKLVGCFSDSSPMIDHGPYTYQSSGNCQKICYGFSNLAMALGNGTDCWCGDYLPTLSSKVDDSRCSTNCAGYPGEKCGAADVWTVWQTGFTLNDVPYYDKVLSSLSSTSPSTSSITVVPTVTAAPTSSPGKGGNTVGIAVGVVVGIIALAAIILGGFLFLRKRQQKQTEEYKSQNGSGPFTDNSRPQMWAPDERLAGSGNRNSVGSIADNQDFSRRILQVRNPDDGF